MTELIDKYFAVGSDGFIALKDVMGSDESIEQAARISYGKGTRKRNETRGLIRYLRRKRHTSPFEQAEMQFHIRVPMDAWRQWIRHRTANVNEYSTRYSEAIDVRATTDSDKWRLQSKKNKQGSSEFLEEWPNGFDLVPDEDGGYGYDNGSGVIYNIDRRNGFSPGGHLSAMENDLHFHSKRVYEERIRLGIAREQARKDLPLSTYTEAFWKCDLHNIMHFLGLRCDSHAQLEIREYADIIAGIIKEIFPLSFEAWYDYVFGAELFTRLDIELMSYEKTLKHSHPKEVERSINDKAKKLGMSNREIDEYREKMTPMKQKDFSLENNELYEFSEVIV